MDNEFNKTVMFDNITFLLKEIGKKIGEFESETGVSSGYLSRTSKDPNTKPGIDFIMKAADALNISVDTLLRVNIADLTPTEKYLMSFLEKLSKDTLNDQLEWHRESAEYLNERLELDINGYCAHPLFSYEKYMEESESGYLGEESRIVFKSRQFDVHTYIAGDCYNLQMKNGAILYVMNICKRVRRAGDTDAYAKEVWMCPRYGEHLFLCGSRDTGEIALLVERLYTAICENVRHPKVNKSVKEVIDAFMNDDMENDASMMYMNEMPFT